MWLDAVTTAATAGALLVAASAYRRAVRREEAGQAAQVIVYWDIGARKFILSNGSPLPIYSCYVSIDEPGTYAHVSHKASTLPGMSVRELDPPPKMSQSRFLDDYVQTTIIFTDAAGVSWSRNPDGQLRRLGHPDRQVPLRNSTVRHADTSRGLKYTGLRVKRWPEKLKRAWYRLWLGV